jgi:hypothetical protein
VTAQDRVVFQIPPVSAGWYGVICGAGDGWTWTATVYWTGEEWSEHPSLACLRSRFGFHTEEEARVWLEKQPD